MTTLASSCPAVSSTVGADGLNDPREDHHVPVRLRDGGAARLRLLRAGETEPLQHVFAQMSERSRADRYLVGVARLPLAMLTALAAVDGHDHVAWLASVGGRPAGVARYLRTGPDAAEVAFEVVDAQQRRGLGSALLDATVTTAWLRGIRTLQARVAPTNHRSLRAVKRLGIGLRHVDGLLEGAGTLRLPDPARVDRDAVATAVRRSASLTPAR